jgi:hypothetical protein
LVEHLLCKQGVIGSNPIVSTRYLVLRLLVLPRRSSEILCVFAMRSSDEGVWHGARGWSGGVMLPGVLIEGVNLVLVRLWVRRSAVWVS